MTLLLVYFYSSNSELDNDLVKIGGLPSLRNYFSSINKLQKRLVYMKKMHDDKLNENLVKEKRIVKIVPSVNNFGP